MTAREFCYWLQGYFEIHSSSNKEGLDVFQASRIKKHLDMVFIHDIDPSYPEGQQESLNNAHNDGFPYGPPKMRC